MTGSYYHTTGTIQVNIIVIELKQFHTNTNFVPGKYTNSTLVSMNYNPKVM